MHGFCFFSGHPVFSQHRVQNIRVVHGNQLWSKPEGLETRQFRECFDIFVGILAIWDTNRIINKVYFCCFIWEQKRPEKLCLISPPFAFTLIPTYATWEMINIYISAVNLIFYNKIILGLSHPGLLYLLWLNSNK